MWWILAIAWGVAQLVALLSGNFLIFVMMLLVDAVWFVGAMLARIANQQVTAPRPTPQPTLANQPRPAPQPTVTRSIAGAPPSEPRAGPSVTGEWLDVLAEMNDLLEFSPPEDPEPDSHVWHTSSVDLARMEFTSSGGADDVSGDTEYILRKVASGWEFKELWTSSRAEGEDDTVRTPLDDVDEEFGVGTPKWDPELEPQYRRRLAKALAWRPLPKPIADAIDEQYKRAVVFFEQRPGLYPGITEEQFDALRPGGAVWCPPTHPETAAPERFVLVCSEGPDRRSFMPLRSRGLLLVGRSGECDWVIHDAGARERQFQLKVNDDSVLFRDLGGGTSINGQPQSEKLLAPGDRISFGSTVVEVRERRSTPRVEKPRERSALALWFDKHPESREALRELDRLAELDAAPIRAVHQERLRPFVEQKERALAVAKAAYEDMVRPYQEELERAVAPLRTAYGKADSDLAEEAARPFNERFYKATESARRMKQEAERLVNEAFEAQRRPLEAQLARELDPIWKRHQPQRTALMASFEEQLKQEAG